MTVHHGKDGVVKTGAVTVAKTTKWTVSEEQGVADTSVQASDYEEHVNGQKKASGSVDCRLDDSDTNGQVALTPGASVTLNLYPDGAAQGMRYWTGTVTITNVNTNSDKGDSNMRSFSWQSNGAFSWATVA